MRHGHSNESELNESADRLLAGVDVGGTNIKVGLLDFAGNVIANSSFPTDPNDHPSGAFKQARDVLEHLLQTNGRQWNTVAAVGLGTPGPMDVAQGVLLTPSNLPGWHHCPVRDLIAETFQTPATLANDANAAAYGEFWVGSGHQYSSMVMLTLGTGVGGGIVIDGMLIGGHHSHGGELGHVVIDSSSTARRCGCGQLGHLEAYASASAFVERTIEMLDSEAGQQMNSVLDSVRRDQGALSALAIAEAAETGDELANRMIVQTAHYLGRGVADLAHVIDPAVFVLGGGMDFGGTKSRLGQTFIGEVVAVARSLVFPVLADNLKVQFASLGSDAGFIGAAGLARQSLLRRN